MSERSLRLAFSGTPGLAASVLQKILENSQFHVALVITQPDRRAGRGRKLTSSPVKLIAEQYGIPIEQPTTADEIDGNQRLMDIDVMVVAAYGMLIPETILNRPKHGCLNIHTSLLPRWRGAAPIQRAIAAGDDESGVTIMQMEKGLDTGPILLQETCPITAADTAGSLHDKLADLGAMAIVKTLQTLLLNGSVSGKPQDHSAACYADKILKAEADIDWQLPAVIIERKIRAFNPTPVCYSTINEQAMRIWQAQATDVSHSTKPGSIIDDSFENIEIACGDGSLLLQKIQLPGKKPITAREFLNGHPEFLSPA